MFNPRFFYREWHSCNNNYTVFLISIHTPTQGVTLAPVFSLPYSFDFNPHSHAGSDLNRMCLPICSLNFNPHSHAGSDQKPQVLQLNGKHFNPHSHAGSDHLHPVRHTGYVKFQSTLPRREWRSLRGCSRYHEDFNPHSHAGSDIGRKWHRQVARSFQSTLPRREWPLQMRQQDPYRNFNPHSHAGSDILRLPYIHGK